MNKISLSLAAVFLILISVSGFGAIKTIRQNELMIYITDYGDQGEACGGVGEIMRFYEGIEGDALPAWVEFFRCGGSRFGCKNWYDPEGDSIVPIKLSGNPYGGSQPGGERDRAFVVPYADGTYIRKYYRYQPPRTVLDGLSLRVPVEREGDYFSSDQVWGTADVMVESHFRMWMGLDVYQRVLVWTQKNHDDYVIYDWTIVNSGNIDLDSVIEREGMSIDSLYFMRQLEIQPLNEAQEKAEWYHWTGVYPTWERPEDSVRLIYSYGALDYRYITYTRDGFGVWDFNHDYLDDVCSAGEVTLYVPQVDANLVPLDPQFPNNPTNNDPVQPKTHGIHGPDDLQYKEHPSTRPISDWQDVYNIMKYGEKGDPVYDSYVDYMTGIYPGTYHPMPMDLRGVAHWNDVEPTEKIFWHVVGHYASGPFNLAFGDTIRIVWATTAGTLPPQSCWDIGHTWKDSTITFVTQSGDTLDRDDISMTFPYVPNAADTIHIPPTYRHNPEEWQDAGYTNDGANLLKDMWVYSTVDTVIRNAINAQWNFDHNYNIPVSPAPPSVEIQSQPERVRINWLYDNPADIPPDLAGYKVYRAIANPGPVITHDGEHYGEWVLIYKCGGTDPIDTSVIYSPTIADTFYDETAVRGENYYYYVAAFDDGTHPESNYPNGVMGTAEVLESGRWQNYSFRPASLQGIPAGTDLSQIRVVPNPCHLGAQGTIQYEGAPDKINFVNLPGICTIRIYNFNGDLLREIQHTSGTGDEAWENPTRQFYLTTSSQQTVVSGVYIAYIETPSGESTTVKFIIVR